MCEETEEIARLGWTRKMEIKLMEQGIGKNYEKHLRYKGKDWYKHLKEE